MRRVLLLALVLCTLGGCSGGPATFAGSWVYDDAATRKENAQSASAPRDKAFWDMMRKAFAPVVISIDLTTGTLTYAKPDATSSGPVRLENNALIWTAGPGREQRYLLNKKGLLETDAGGHVLLFKKK